MYPTMPLDSQVQQYWPDIVYVPQVDDESCHVSGIKVSSKRTARQYMNRRGGFNRPLPIEQSGKKVIRD